jgi:hypothetical protein
MSRRLCAAALLVATTATLAACGGGDDAPAPAASETAYLPTGSPTKTVTMLKPPADYSTIRGTGFAISAPGEFQRQEKKSSNGEPMLVLEKPSSVPALPQRVAVIRDVKPKSPASEQSFALEAAKGAAGPQGKAERSQLPAPEGQSSFLTTWNETRPSAGGSTVEMTYWQLMYQVDAELIINVVALAPAQEFETSEVSKILRTFTPSRGASA